MKVKYKSIAIAGISGVIIILVAWLIFYNVYFEYIHKEHTKEIKKAINTVEEIISYEENNLKNTVIDWSHWDDTYTFVNDKNDNFIQANLQDNSLKNLKISMIIFLDSKGNIINTTNYGLDNETIENINKNGAFIKNNPENTNKSGILVVKDKMFLVDASSILKSDEKSPTNGTLIMLRQIDEELIHSFQAVSDYTFSLAAYNGTSNKVNSEDYSISSSKKKVKITKLISDINGNKNVFLSLERKNTNYKEMIIYFHKFIIFFLIFMIILLYFNYIILNKYIFKRFISLYKFITKVAKTKDISLRLEMSGKDELFILTNATNEMLAVMDSAFEDIKKINERFRVIMEATNDGYIDYYVGPKEIYISPEWKKNMGYEGNDGVELYKDYLSRIHPECYEKNKNTLLDFRAGKSEYLDIEYRVIKRTGEIIWVHQRGKIVERDADNKATRTVSTLTNITDRKKYEEEILFLSYSDKLTGLRNRAYMENKFEELDKIKDLKYFIVMGDVNGLKQTNDALGHKKGDILINMIGQIFNDVCAKDDIVARWGGDEFVILIKNKNEKYVSSVINKIREMCKNIDDFIFDVSISLGYAEKSEKNLDVESVMSLAEKRMYRNKLMENKSARNSIISSLLRTLHEKNSETEEHTIRIKNLSSKLGKRIGLTQDKLDELELLSLLHDIGKIGIPENILLKPSKLTEEEWKIMKTHTDIGYRIAKHTPELEHISEAILYHHERYDGTGYPKGLMKHEIPLISRIINIVDSFDVITHKRVYKGASDTAYAVSEINKWAGKQFDPYLSEEFIKLLIEENIIKD